MELKSKEGLNGRHWNNLKRKKKLSTETDATVNVTTHPFYQNITTHPPDNFPFNAITLNHLLLRFTKIKPNI